MRKLVLLRLFALPLALVVLFSFLSISTVSAQSAHSSIKLHPDGATITCTYSPDAPFIGLINHVKYVIFEGTVTCTGGNWGTATITASGYEDSGTTQVATFTGNCTANTNSCSAWTGVLYVTGHSWQSQISITPTAQTGSGDIFVLPTSPGSSAFVPL